MKRTPERAAKRAAIYTRKSTSAGLEQDFNSLDAQREACASYAKSQGWTIAGTYDDGGFTGANIDRPAFQRLLADVDAGRIDVVLVYKIDRLSRSLLDFAKVMDRLNAGGAALVSVTQNFSTADAIGKLTLNMLMSFAEFEREMIGERTRDKIAASRRRGKWTGGNVPIGYYAIDKKLVKNAPEAMIVQEVFDLYERHRSLLAVMKELHARGRTMRKREWSKDGVLRVLKNPLHAGLIACGNELCAGEHEAILAREQFERVQQLLERPAVAHTGKNPAYLLRGLLRCGACGAAMTPAGTRTYRYYRCVTRDKKGAASCSSRPLPAQAIETFVVERLREIAVDRSYAADLTERVGEGIATARQAAVAARGGLPATIAKLAAEVTALFETLADVSGHARQLAADRLEALATAQHTAQLELDAVERRVAALDLARVDAEWITNVLGDFDGLWELMTPDNRQRVVTAIVESITVDETKGGVTLKLASLAFDGDRAA